MATARLKTSARPSRVPTTQDLSLGEFGINTYDGALYFKRLDADGEAIVTVNVGERQPAIADDSSGAANSATVNAVLAALRAYGLIET